MTKQKLSDEERKARRRESSRKSYAKKKLRRAKFDAFSLKFQLDTSRQDFANTNRR